MSVELIQAGVEYQSVFENLLQLYVHDFCDLVPQDIGDDGRYSYKNLPLFWSDASRLPFLARFDGKLAGFALVKRIPEPGEKDEAYDMAEFFILRPYRRRGIGSELAQKVWLRCGGKWQIRVMASNIPALKFWASSITRFTGQPASSTVFEVEGRPWQLFAFDSRT